jgi:hypothetical protein
MPKSNIALAAPESPSVNPSAEGSLPFGLARNEGRLILFVLAMKALLLWVGVVSAEIYTNQRLGGPIAWLDMWYRWDTTHYLEIAEKGYVQEGDLKYNLAFFPLYPLLIRLGMLVGMAPIAAAIFVTTIASLFAAVLMYRLFHLDVAVFRLSNRVLSAYRVHRKSLFRFYARCVLSGAAASLAVGRSVWFLRDDRPHECPAPPSRAALGDLVGVA